MVNELKGFHEPESQKVAKALLTVVVMHGILASLPPNADYSPIATMDIAEQHADIALGRLNKILR